MIAYNSLSELVRVHVFSGERDMGFLGVRGEQIIYLVALSRSTDSLFLVQLFTLGFCGSVMGPSDLVY